LSFNQPPPRLPWQTRKVTGSTSSEEEGVPYNSAVADEEEDVFPPRITTLPRVSDSGIRTQITLNPASFTLNILRLHSPNLDSTSLRVPNVPISHPCFRLLGVNQRRAQPAGEVRLKGSSLSCLQNEGQANFQREYLLSPKQERNLLTLLQ